MQIQGPAHVHSAQSISAPHALRGPTGTQASTSRPIQDELQISDAAHLLDQVRQLPDIRQDRVNQLRALIAEGNYETGARLGGAIEGLLDEIG